MRERAFSVAAGGRQIRGKWIGADRGGPPLVFLHEGLGSAAQWRDFPETLAARAGLPAIVYDRYGHGRSEPLRERRNLRYLFDEALVSLPAVLVSLGVRRPFLVGHSDGGSIALIYASSGAPAQGVIVEAAHTYVETTALDGIRRTVEAYESGGLRERLERYHGERTEAVFRGWAETWLSPAFRDFRIDVSAIRCPVLALQGADDEYATPAQLASLSGIAETVLLPDCGHTPHRDACEDVLERMAAFVAHHSPPDSAHAPGR